MSDEEKKGGDKKAPISDLKDDKTKPPSKFSKFWNPSALPGAKPLKVKKKRGSNPATSAPVPEATRQLLLDEDKEIDDIYKETGLKEIVTVRYQLPTGKFLPSDLSAEIRKRIGSERLEEKTKRALEYARKHQGKFPKQPVLTPLPQDENVKNELIKHCATSVTDFCAVFLGDHHITKGFGSFHLELLRDLYNLSASSKTDNYAKCIRDLIPASDNVYYYVKNSVTAENDSIPSAFVLRDIPQPDPLDDGLTTSQENGGSKVIESNGIEKASDMDGLAGGQAVGVAENTPLTVENFSDQTKVPVQDIKPPEHLFFDLSPPYPDNMSGLDRFDRLAIAAPRGHAKSTLVSLAYVLWCIVYKVHRFILIISDSEDQAKLLLNSIRQELESNERLKATYGPMQGDKIWGELVLETSNGIRIQTRGTGQRIRGMKYRSYRPQLVICDDIESDELVETEDRRRKLKRWFHGALLPAVDVEGKVIIIGTILHEDGLLPDLLSSWPSRLYAADRNKDPACTQPLWPENYRPEDLLRMKDDYAKKGMLDLFFREYFNQIVSTEDALFPARNFKSISVSEVTDKVQRGERLKCFLTVDPAYSNQAQRDYTAFCVCYVDSAHNMYVADIIRGRYAMPQTIQILFNLVEKYDFDGIGMQRIDWDKSFKIPVETEMRRRQKFFRVTPLQVYSAKAKGLANKASRIARLAPRYEVGQIYHIKEAKGIRELEGELKAYPHSRYDDCMDALSMQLDLLFPAEKKKMINRYRFDDVADPISGY